MVRQKSYAATNITGLAFAIASCVFIYLFVQHELSYNKHFARHDSSYRVVRDLIAEDNLIKVSAT